ncbi:MAG: Rid family detoxifying hydrolase [Deltaproteobacteria bacterium]|nr:Rid family detoxifying hydrolase [Deltaproteobacteria bacterium]
MNRTVVKTAAAPAAIGPYSQAVVVPVGDSTMVFCSGQIPLDPATGQMVEGDVSAQARRVLDNVGAVLAAAGAGFADIVKTTMFLVDLGDFAAVNALYAERFIGPPPARSTIQVARLPRDSRVEIEVTAVIRRKV